MRNKTWLAALFMVSTTIAVAQTTPGSTSINNGTQKPTQATHPASKTNSGTSTSVGSSRKTSTTSGTNPKTNAKKTLKKSGNKLAAPRAKKPAGTPDSGNTATAK